MRRRLAAALACAVLLASSVPAPRASAAGPWSVAEPGRLAAAAITSDPGRADVTLALENRTSVADELRLPRLAALALEALGLSGSFSQSASWTALSGPRVECPGPGANLDCRSWGGGGGGVALVPGPVRLSLLAHAPPGAGRTDITVTPTMASLRFDLALVALGVVLDAVCAGGARIELAAAVYDLVARTAPMASGVATAVLRRDSAAAGAELLALSNQLLMFTLEHGTGHLLGGAVCRASSAVPGLVAVRLGIAVAKAVVPLVNLAASLLLVQPVTVGVLYAGGGPGAGPTPTAAPTATAAAGRPDATWVWRAVPAPPFPLEYGALLLRDGRLLFQEVISQYVCEGNSTGELRATARMAAFDPRDDSWTVMALAPLIPRQMALMGAGKVLAIGDGGWTEDGSGTPAEASIFDPAADRWLAAPLPAGIGEPVLTTLADGRPVAVGEANIQVFDPVLGQWTVLTMLRHPRSGPEVALLSDGRLLVAGGQDDNGAVMTDELFDLASGQTSAIAGLTRDPVDYGYAVTAQANGSAVGYRLDWDGREDIAHVAVLDPIAGSWSQQTDLTGAVGFSGWLVRPDSSVLQVGGATSDCTDPSTTFSPDVRLFDLASGTVTTLAPMPVAQMGPDVAALADGSVFTMSIFASGGQWVFGPPR